MVAIDLRVMLATLENELPVLFEKLRLVSNDLWKLESTIELSLWVLHSEAAGSAVVLLNASNKILVVMVQLS